MTDEFDIFNFQPDDLIDFIEDLVKRTLSANGPIYTQITSVNGKYKNRVADYIDNTFRPYLRKSSAFKDINNISFNIIHESYHDCERDGWVSEWYIVTRRDK